MFGKRDMNAYNSASKGTASSVCQIIGVNAAGVARVETPQYSTYRGRPVLTTPNILYVSISRA